MASEKKAPLLLRLPLRILSFAVSLVLVVCLFATAFLLDLRILTSHESLKSILTEAASATSSQSQPSQPAAQSSPYAVKLSTTEIPPEVGNALEDSLRASDITGMVEEILGSALGEDVAVDTQQVVQFLQESTVMDYLAEKVSSYADDIINGTADTIITTEELMQLVEENQSLIEETFQVEITPEMKAEIQEQVRQTVEEEDLNGTIHQTIAETAETAVTLPLIGTVTVGEILETVRQLTETRYLIMALVICVVLMAVLLALSYYNLSVGVRRCGRACMTVGTPLAVFSLFVRFGGNLLARLLDSSADMVATAQSALSPLEPVHYGLLLLGIGLTVLAFVGKELRKNE